MKAQSDVFMTVFVILNDSSGPRPGRQSPGATQPCYSLFFNYKKAIDWRYCTQILRGGHYNLKMSVCCLLPNGQNNWHGFWYHSTNWMEATSYNEQMLLTEGLANLMDVERHQTRSSCCCNSLYSSTETPWHGDSHSPPAAAQTASASPRWWRQATPDLQQPGGA